MNCTEKAQWCQVEVHFQRRWTEAVGRDTWRHMWSPHWRKSTCRQSVPARFLLARSPPGCNCTRTKCEACQFHAKQIYQPAQALQTIPLSWPFSVWGLDILGPFPHAVGGFEYLYVAIDKFTKWPEVEPVKKEIGRAHV